MFAIYREHENTLIFSEGYWTTLEAAHEACGGEPQRRRLHVCPVELLAGDVEVAGGRIVRPVHIDSRPMYDVSARIVATGHRQSIGWYSTLCIAMKKRRKYIDDRDYDEWVIERSSMEATMWSDNVDGDDTESG